MTHLYSNDNLQSPTAGVELGPQVGLARQVLLDPQDPKDLMVHLVNLGSMVITATQVVLLLVRMVLLAQTVSPAS